MSQCIENIVQLYKITCTINQKIYTGQSVNPKQRWQQHKYDAKRHANGSQAKDIILIDKKIAQYGVENFTFEVVATCWNYQDANDTETLLVKQYDSHISNGKGYNVAYGGSNAPKTDEWRQQLSDWHASLSAEEKQARSQAQREWLLNRIATQGHPCQGQKRTPEQKQKMSDAQQNRDNNYTPEMRQKMSEAHIGYKATEEAKQNQSVAITASWAQRNAEREATEEIWCHAEGCKVKGAKHHYIILDGIRYCSLHGQRLRNTGSLELLPENRTPWNKGQPMSEETKLKLGNSLKGRIPHNKMSFTEAQITQIMSDERSLTKIAKDYNVSRKVITRIKSGN